MEIPRNVRDDTIDGMSCRKRHYCVVLPRRLKSSDMSMRGKIQVDEFATVCIHTVALDAEKKSVDPFVGCFIDCLQTFHVCFDTRVDFEFIV